MQTNSTDHVLAPLLTSCDLWLLFSNYIYFDFIKNVRDGILLRSEVQRFTAQIQQKELFYWLGVRNTDPLRMFAFRGRRWYPHILSATYQQFRTVPHNHLPVLISVTLWVTCPILILQTTSHLIFPDCEIKDKVLLGYHRWKYAAFSIHGCLWTQNASSLCQVLFAGPTKKSLKFKQYFE